MKIFYSTKNSHIFYAQKQHTINELLSHFMSMLFFKGITTGTAISSDITSSKYPKTLYLSFRFFADFQVHQNS